MSASSPPNPKSRTFIDFCFLLVVFIVARLPAVERGLAPTLGWRPADLASLTLNYFRNGFHFFYPQINWGGAGPGYVEMECPIVPYFTAILYALFGVHDLLALVVPLLSGILIVFTAYGIARRLFPDDRLTALLAGGFAAISPTLIDQTMGYWNDPPAIAAGCLSVYLLLRWTSSRNWKTLIPSAAAFALAGLLKLTMLYYGLPLAFILWGAYPTERKKMVPLVLLYGVVALLPIVAWYAYAYELGKLYGNTFGILAGGYSKFPTAALLKDPHFYGSALFHAAMYHMTPVVALLFLVGLWGSISKRQQSANGVLLVWLGSVALYALVAGKGVAEGHYQYLLGVVPVCSLIAAYGGGMTVRALDEKFLSRQGRAARIAFGGTLLVVLLLFWKLGDARYVRSQETFALPDWRMKRTTGLLVNQLTPQGSLIVVIDDQMDDYTPTTCMTPPDIFYFGDRKGWYRSMAWIRPDEFDRFAAQGACYVVVSGHSMRTWKQNHQDLDAYLHERCKVVYEGEEGIIFALGENGQHEAGELGECLEGAVGRKH